MFAIMRSAEKVTKTLSDIVTLMETIGRRVCKTGDSLNQLIAEHKPSLHSRLIKPPWTRQ